MSYRILAVNPGSTSTRIAVYEDEAPVFTEHIKHSNTQLDRFENYLDQYELRMKTVLDVLEQNGVEPSGLSAVVGRGGMLPPVKGGGHLVNADMLAELRGERSRPHASNLGAIIADAIARPLGIPAYIYDAVSTDELDDVARITGIPEVVRQSYSHVLNAKATARKTAEALGKRYEDCRFIVAHIGGGISITAHEGGRIIDVIGDDDGPFSPERAGSVPLGYIIDICYNKGLSQKELMYRLKNNCGMKGHLGTSDGLEIERRIAEGDENAARVYEAQAYQIAKGIGEMAPVVLCAPDAVIITGGLAYSEYIVGELKRRVGKLGPVYVYPGEMEMEALALGALRILRGEEQANLYYL